LIDSINILAITSFLYGCENWTLKQWDVQILQTAEVNFMNHAAGYILYDHRRNRDILE
jgi:hypothetical protein